MLSTASALLQASQDAIIDHESMMCAAVIYHKHNEMSQEQFKELLYQYASILVSNATDKVARVLLTETQWKELITTIGELEDMENEVLNGK